MLLGWNDRAALAVAAIHRKLTQQPVIVKDEGGVRAELLSYMATAAKRAKGLAIDAAIPF